MTPPMVGDRLKIDLYELEGRIDCDDGQAYIMPDVSPSELMALVWLARAQLAARKAMGYTKTIFDEHYEITDTKEKP